MEAYQCERKSERRPGLFWGLGLQLLVYGLLLFSHTALALCGGVFYVPAGDVAGLIAAINAANANGEENTINLEPGIYTLVGWGGGGGNGLPVITGSIRIKPSAGDPSTVIERASGPRGVGVSLF